MRSSLAVALGLLTLLWAAPAQATTVDEVIQWTHSRTSEKEQLERLGAQTRVEKPTSAQIAKMRLVGVPEAVIDFMVKFKGLGTTAPTRSTQQPSDSAGTSSSERLTVDLIVRLAQEHKRSVRGFAAALSVTRGQVKLRSADVHLLASRGVKPAQIAALRFHNPQARCSHSSDCVGGTTCSARRCINLSGREAGVSASHQAGGKQVLLGQGGRRHRFGHGFLMGGLGVTRSTAVDPSSEDAEEETVWNVDLSVRVAYVTPIGFYIGGRAWYDSALDNGDGDGSGALLAGFLISLSEEHPIFLDIGADVTSVNEELTVRGGLGLAVALGEDHPIFLHAELVTFESGGASSRGNVGLGVRF